MKEVENCIHFDSCQGRNKCLKFDFGKCTGVDCGHFEDKSEQSNQGIVNEAMELASKKCGKETPSRHQENDICTCNAGLRNSIELRENKCKECDLPLHVNQSELAVQPKQTTEKICSCAIPYFPTGDTTHCSKCNKITIYGCTLKAE